MMWRDGEDNRPLLRNIPSSFCLDFSVEDVYNQTPESETYVVGQMGTSIVSGHHAAGHTDRG